MTEAAFFVSGDLLTLAPNKQFEPTLRGLPEPSPQRYARCHITPLPLFLTLSQEVPQNYTSKHLALVAQIETELQHRARPFCICTRLLFHNRTFQPLLSYCMKAWVIMFVDYSRKIKKRFTISLLDSSNSLHPVLSKPILMIFETVFARHPVRTVSFYYYRNDERSLSIWFFLILNARISCREFYRTSLHSATFPTWTTIYYMCSYADAWWEQKSSGSGLLAVD